MKDKKWLMGLIVNVLILTVLRTPSFALSSKSNLATLHGLSGVGVLVEKLPAEIEKEGLTTNQLQIEVELKLRAAGIKVFARENSPNVPGEPYLYVNININIAKTESDVYPYSIDAMLIQQVYLIRHPQPTVYAVTWSTGGVGSISKEFVGQLRSSVEDIVDIFIKAYLSENPIEKEETNK